MTSNQNSWFKLQRNRVSCIEVTIIKITVITPITKVDLTTEKTTLQLIPKKIITPKMIWFSWNSRELWDKLSIFYRNSHKDTSHLKRTMINLTSLLWKSNQKILKTESISGLTALWMSALFSALSVCLHGNADISMLWRELWIIKRNLRIGSWVLRLLPHHRPLKQQFQSSVLPNNQLWFTNHK